MSEAMGRDPGRRSFNPDEYDPLRDKEYVNPNMVVWEYRKGLCASISDAVARYVFWSITLAIRGNRPFCMREKAIAARLGVKVSAVRSAVRRTKLFHRCGRQGQRGRHWAIGEAPGEPSDGQEMSRGDSLHDAKQWVSETHSMSHGDSLNGEIMSHPGFSHNSAVLLHNEETVVKGDCPHIPDSHSSSRDPNPEGEGGEPDGSPVAMPSLPSTPVPGTPTPPVAPAPPSPERPVEGRPARPVRLADGSAGGRWLMGEFRRLCSSQGALHAYNERDCDTINGLAGRRLTPDRWTSLIGRWLIDQRRRNGGSPPGKSDLVPRKFAAWLDKAGPDAGPMETAAAATASPPAAPRASPPASPPAAPRAARDSIAESMKLMFSGSRQEGIWSASRIWGVVLTAQWMAGSSADPCSEIRDCLLSRAGTEAGLRDVRSVLAVTLKWEPFTELHHLAMADWRERLAKVIEKAGMPKPFPPARGDKEAVDVFVMNIRRQAPK